MRDSRRSSSGESRLADRAKADAARLTPRFSSQMHERIMQAVNDAPRARREIARPAQAGWLRYWAGGLAMAAALAMVISPQIFLSRTAAISPKIVRPAGHPMAIAVAGDQPAQLNVYSTAHEMNTQVQSAVQNAIAQDEFAGLDHDVRTATAFLVDQVPLRSAWNGKSTGR